MKLNKELAMLRQENEDLRELVRNQTKEYYEQVSRMRQDPTYWASGVYSFTTAYKDRYFHVEIFSGDVRLIEKHKDHDLILMQVPPVAPIDYRTNKSEDGAI
jgi:hypothetical protein